MTKFEEMIMRHKQMVADHCDLAANYIHQKGQNHDNDKIEPGIVKEIYDEHFPVLKQIEFQTPQYVAYEREHFTSAHRLHAQNRHHYYSQYNDLNDIDLFDVLEAIIDIKQSQKQYSTYSYQKLLETFQTKGVLDLDIEQLVMNTVKCLDRLEDER